VAQWLGAVPSALHALKDAAGRDTVGGRIRGVLGNGFVALELLLFALTCVLQVGVHYVGNAAEGGLAPLVWSFVPLGLLISMGLVPAVASRLSAALAAAVQAADQAGTQHPTSPRRQGVRSGGPAQVSGGESTPAGGVDDEPAEAISGPDQRTDEEAFAELRQAVQSGRLDPKTSRPVDPDSASSIQRTLKVGRTRSRELRERWAQQQG